MIGLDQSLAKAGAERAVGLGLLLFLVVITVACGNQEAAQPRTAQSTPTTPTTEDALAPKSTKGDPRDLVSFTNLGTAVTAVSYRSYEQLRDYSDLAMIGTIQRFAVADEFDDPFILPGELQVELTVDAVLGGRMTDIGVGDPVSMVLPLDARADLFAQYRDRLEELRGARFALFLVQMVGDQPSRRFTPILYNAPPAILAEWPNDGRLSPVQAHDYLALEAIQRGVEKTGVPYEGEPEWTPTFQGGAPVGLTVKEAAKEFAGTPGQPVADPPAGWDKAEPGRAEVPAGT